MIEVNNDTFQQLVLDSSDKLLVYFYLKSCQFCEEQSNNLELIKAKYNIPIYVVDGDKEPLLLDNWFVEDFPTILFFSEGDCVNTICGLQEISELVSAVESLISDI